MTHRITIEEFQKRAGNLPVIDVRAPAEFIHGHIPGAVSLPLFTDAERAQVGTTYKQQGREAAILLGFDLTGPKWSGFVRRALEIAPGKKLAVHCWRGGMRSSVMAWALDLYGFEIYLLQGGYKSYRRWVARQWERPYPFWVIGGYTGSGKTHILLQLGKAGEQVVDLEDLAQHQGSSYGSLNRLVQPTQEQFENNLAATLSRLDPARKIWIEDESQNIGRCLLPKPFWIQLRSALSFDLQAPVDQRVRALLREYGSLDKDFLVACTERIRKRLGPEQTKQAIAAIGEDRMEDFIRLVLVYYDKTYRRGLSDRDPRTVVEVPLSDEDPAVNARKLLKAAETRKALLSV
ncbi:MAG TPA: tRNA 2-selenouridine(34) synthase MnmH [Puia sp.]|nr:tRNA 2-selenouridine(34) synthase MnmH [Puia sp.]